MPHHEAAPRPGGSGGQATASEAVPRIVPPATDQAGCRRPEPYSSPKNGTTLGVAERDVIGQLLALAVDLIAASGKRAVR